MSGSAKRLIGGGLQVLLIKGLSIICRLIILALYSQIVSPESFGALSLALTIVEIGRTLADAGVDLYATKRFAGADSPGLLLMHLGRMVKAKLLLTLATWLVLGLAAILCFDWNMSWVLLAALPLIASTLLQSLPVSYFQGTGRLQEVSFGLVLVYGFGMIAIVASSYLHRSSWITLLSLSALEATAGLWLITKLEKIIGFPSLLTIWEAKTYPLLSQAWPFAVATIVSTLYLRLDTLFVSKICDSSELGLYTFASRLIEPLQFFFTAFALSMFSEASTLREKDVWDYTRTTFRKYLLAVTSMGLLVYLMAGIFGSLLIQWKLHQFSGSQGILYLLAGVALVRTVTTSTGTYLQGVGRSQLISRIACWNLVVVIVSMSLLTYSWGALGAAAALLLSELQNTVIQIYFLYRLRSIDGTANRALQHRTSV